ncbi:hypothetical protein [Olsenella urininfantis]|uniref:hypothetical protein n=1 Tax=Olsenella urininfantis TaxID=1871033 RepID=UPI0009872761|nr:hypothetical protein [Olsenella urininfantis]
MGYVPSAVALRGMTVTGAEKMGKPHFGAYYAGSGVRTNRLVRGARCAVCGAPATNSHHEPQVGMGGGRASLPLAGHGLRPALIALCGSGTTGCHGMVHAGLLRIAWEWDGDGSDWWEGRLPGDLYEGNAAGLYGLGCWVVRDRGGRVIRKIREEM